MSDLDDMIREMRTVDGFMKVFWAELAKVRREVPATSRERVFNMLNYLYFSFTGRPRYASWNCFRSTMGRRKPDPVDDSKNKRVRNLRRTLLR
jgi:hypothetical protein